MTSTSNFENIASRRAAERLRISCSSLINGPLAGGFDSAFRGDGMEYEETRPYQPGDEVRAIDWRVTARLQKPYVKTFRQQRQLTIQLLVDGSGSMRVAGLGRTVADVVREVASLLIVIAESQGDRIGLIIFDDQISIHRPTNDGMQHVARLILDLIRYMPTSAPARPSDAVNQIIQTERHRNLIIVIGDFYEPDSIGSLRLLSKLHEVWPIVVRHISEIRLPRCGMLRATDPETGRGAWIDTFSERQRTRFNNAAQQRRRSETISFSRYGLRPLYLSTNDSVVAGLHRYFTDRTRGTS